MVKFLNSFSNSPLYEVYKVIYEVKLYIEKKKKERMFSNLYFFL